MAPDDMELVREYAARGSESAFEALVSRYSGLVYSTALRQVRNPQLAEEVTQAVFVILARKTSSLGAKTILPSWLYRTAWYVSSAAVKGELRRQRREQEACMQSSFDEAKVDATWLQLAPLLDEAMQRLNQRDRAALVLRFFEDRSMREVGDALGASEEAAKKRVGRALEKLQSYFSKRGVKSTAAIIAGAISAHSVQAVPAALAKSVATVAVAKGAAVSTSTVALMNGALKLMVWAKARKVIAAATGVLLVAGTATIAAEKIHDAIAAHASDPWRTGNINPQALNQLSPQVSILPSTFPAPGRRGIRSAGNGGDRKMAGLGYRLREIFAAIFARNDARIFFATLEPAGRYDFICTFPTGQSTALQKELEQQFGLSGAVAMKETDVLLLTMKHPNATGLKPSVAPPETPASVTGGRGRTTGANSRLDKLANDLEQRLGLPVVDQTGLDNERFDFDLSWEQTDTTLNIDGLKQALLDQLGLELVPARRTVEMVVVDNAKR